MDLPPLVTEKRKWGPALLLTALHATLYALTDRFHPRTPVPLRLTWIDAHVPLVGWTLWVYASYPLIFVVAFALERCPRAASRYLWASLALNVASNACFLAFPTTLDRSPYSFSAPFALLHALDAPSNCLPSLHVSTSYLSSFVFWRRRPLVFALTFAWANAIALSTLTTKQHYAVDVLAGLALALVAYALFFCREVKRPRSWVEPRARRTPLRPS